MILAIVLIVYGLGWLLFARWAYRRSIHFDSDPERMGAGMCALAALIWPLILLIGAVAWTVHELITREVRIRHRADPARIEKLEHELVEIDEVQDFGNAGPSWRDWRQN